MGRPTAKRDESWLKEVHRTAGGEDMVEVRAVGRQALDLLGCRDGKGY